MDPMLELVFAKYVFIQFLWCWTGKAAEWTEEELEQTAEAIGYGAVK